MEQKIKDLVYSVIIGDGFVKKTGAIELCHGNKQLDFLIWKKDLIEEAVQKNTIKIRTRVRK